MDKFSHACVCDQVKCHICTLHSMSANLIQRPPPPFAATLPSHRTPCSSEHSACFNFLCCETHKSSRKCRVKLRVLTAWVHGTDVRPIAHWRRFKVRWQASMPGDSAGRATDTRYQRLYSHSSNTRTQQFSVRRSIYMAKPRHTRTNHQNGFIQRVLRLRR